MKPNLKPLANNRSKLKFDVLLSNSAFEFNLRRYSKERANSPTSVGPGVNRSPRHSAHFEPSSVEFTAIYDAASNVCQVTAYYAL
jgi:hypothetical protein